MTSGKRVGSEVECIGYFNELSSDQYTSKRYFFEGKYLREFAEKLYVQVPFLKLSAEK